MLSIRDEDLLDGALREAVGHTLTRELMRPSDYCNPRPLTSWPTREHAPREPFKRGALPGSRYHEHALALGVELAPGVNSALGAVAYCVEAPSAKVRAKRAEEDRVSAILDKRANEYAAAERAATTRRNAGSAAWTASE